MRTFITVLLPAFFAGFSLLFASQCASAQIIGSVEADLTHPFIIANTTLPAGKYEFRMVGNTDLNLMSAANWNDKTRIEFQVDRARDNHRPQHTELIFARYGNQEFLRKIFEAGDPVGVQVVEPSRLEQRLQKHGQHAVEHTEEQAK